MQLPPFQPPPSQALPGLHWGTHLGFPRQQWVCEGEGLHPALHLQPKGTETLTPFLCPCCKQPACSSISWLVYRPPLKQSQVRNSTEHIPAPMLSLARVSPHAFFACSQQRTLAFFAKFALHLDATKQKRKRFGAWPHVGTGTTRDGPVPGCFLAPGLWWCLFP